MAMNYGIRSSAYKLLNAAASVPSKSVNRGIHSTSVKKMGGGHGTHGVYLKIQKFRSRAYSARWSSLELFEANKMLDAHLEIQRRHWAVSS